jgi:tryptophan synthase alpha chain
MSRIQQRFEQLRAEGRKALIPFVTAGDPNPETTVPLMHALVEAGCDIIELGVPFSDPMADGPVIQHASERALAHHVSLRRVLEMVREFRRSDGQTPVVLMGYLNPIEVMGYQTFADAAAESGVDGVLTVDLPPEEAEAFLATLRPHGLDAIFLVAPTTGPERLKSVCAVASGFVYYISVKGVTGAAQLDVKEIATKVGQVRAATDLPVGVGFGIKDGESAAAVAAVADAVIVGSALVRRIEGLQAQPERIPEEVKAFVGELRRAIDGAGESG